MKINDDIIRILTNLSSLEESSINRVAYWIENFECVMISAYRQKQLYTLSSNEYKVRDEFVPVVLKKDGEVYTDTERKQRSAQMIKIVVSLGYGITPVVGRFPEEDGSNIKKFNTERSYLVVNLKKDLNFKKTMLELGVAFNQDSIAYKPKDISEWTIIVTNAKAELFSIDFVPGVFKVDNDKESNGGNEYYSSLRTGRLARDKRPKDDESFKYKTSKVGGKEIKQVLPQHNKRFSFS